MKTYKTLTELRQDWKIMSDLQKFLENYGFPTSRQTILRWEKIGLLPKPKRAIIKQHQWRVYDEDYFIQALDRLNRLPKRVIVGRGVKMNE